MQERRSSGRTRAFLGGIVAYNYGFSARCLVRNSGPTGMMMVISASVPLPEEVEFTDDRSGNSQRIRLVWRRDDRVGAAFLRPTNVVPLALMRQLRREFSSQA